MASRGLRALHPHLYIGGTVGFGDPSETVLLLSATRELDRRVSDRIELDIYDDFLEDTTQLSGRMGAWVMPAEVALVLLVWLVRADTRRVLFNK